MTVVLRLLDTRDNVLYPQPGDVFVSVSDLLAYLDRAAVSIVDVPEAQTATPAQVIATLAQQIADDTEVTA